MSLYIGKVEDKPVLHLTEGITEISSIKTLEPIPSTIIHSEMPLVNVRYHGRVYGTYVVDGNYRYWRVSDPQSFLDEVAGGRVSFFISKDPFGKIENIWNGLPVSLYLIPYFGPRRCAGWSTDYPTFEYFMLGGSTTYSCYLDRGVGVAPYIDFYTADVDMVEPTGSEILISSDNINIGSTFLKDNMYLSINKVNDIDPYITVAGVGEMQIINSKKDEVDYGGVSLKNTSIYATYKNADYPIFTSDLKTICSVKNITEVYGVYLSDGVARITVPYGNGIGTNFYVRLIWNGAPASSFIISRGTSTQSGCHKYVGSTCVLRAGYDGGNYIYFWHSVRAVFHELT